MSEVIDRLILIEHLVRALHAKISEIGKKEGAIMVELSEIQAKADAELAQLRAETDVMNAVKTLVENQVAKMADLQSQIQALMAAGSASQADLQALSDTIDAIMAADTSNAAIVSAAVAAGTPAEPPPAEPPPPMEV